MICQNIFLHLISLKKRFRFPFIHFLTESAVNYLKKNLAVRHDFKLPLKKDWQALNLILLFFVIRYKVERKWSMYHDKSLVMEKKWNNSFFSLPIRNFISSRNSYRFIITALSHEYMCCVVYFSDNYCKNFISHAPIL